MVSRRPCTNALSLDAAAEVFREAMRDTVKRYALWYLIQGVLLIAAGVLAIIYPVLSSAAVVVLLGWLLALALSTTTGSTTVGIVAATGILAPLVTEAGSWHTSLIVVAIGAGSLGLNYVNHAGFWLVKESFGMSLGQAVKTQTAV